MALKQLEINYNSARSLSALLKEHGLSAQKKFGQNFLINPKARSTLVGALDLRGGEDVWEIGAGLGAMTSLLLETGSRVRAFEIDRGFCAVLKTLFQDNANFCLCEGDVLESAFTDVNCEKARSIKLFGNLPYNIGARLLARFVERRMFFKRIVVLLQREVAERITALAGDKNYSAFSVLTRHYYDVKLLSYLSGASFYPSPNVESAALSLTLKTGVPDGMKEPVCFIPLLHALFSSRRKTLKNNLRSFLEANLRGECSSMAERILNECGVPRNARAEDLGDVEFSKLAAFVESVFLRAAAGLNAPIDSCFRGNDRQA